MACDGGDGGSNGARSAWMLGGLDTEADFHPLADGCLESHYKVITDVGRTWAEQREIECQDFTMEFATEAFDG